MSPRYMHTMSSRLIRQIVDSYELKRLDFGLSDAESCSLKGYKEELRERSKSRETHLNKERDMIRKTEELRKKI